MCSKQIIVLLFWFASLVQHSFAGEQVPDHCPVTRPPHPAFVPPSPFPARETGRFWLGTNALWTSLAEDGIWTGIVSSSGTRNKFWWWREGWEFDTDRRANEPGLIINARRLDGEAPQVSAPRVTNAGEAPTTAMLLMLELPTSGCWEITANYRSEYLSIVVWVPTAPASAAGRIRATLAHFGNAVICGSPSRFCKANDNVLQWLPPKTTNTDLFRVN